MDDGGAMAWSRLRELVDEAMSRPRAERLGMLRERCAGDAALMAAVEPLLRAAEAAASKALRGEPADATAETGPPPSVPVSLGRFEPGTRVGQYEILQHVGAGTFGDVYLAESAESSRQRVALKVIKAGMDSAEVLARFEQEQATLGLMSHSGIARLFSVGSTDDGRPYFAMEHVPGVPITQHCDAQRLSIEERLHLVARVCEAVQHAHQKGIIHRDLKPANVLVAYEGVRAIPKVIDFGVAKALTQPLTARSLFTQFARLIGTPAYMAPEQAEGGIQELDTRADVYSLGTVLYELLTGRLPLDLSSLSHDETKRRIREQEPVPPSRRFAALLKSDPEAAAAIASQRGLTPAALVKRLAGDLDWITMRCLEKERSRRYAGVDRLADDLHRHLAFKPVEARPPSATYRARRFVRRHRGAVAAAIAVALVLAVVTAQSIVFRQARKQNDRLAARELLERGRLMLHSAGDAWRPDVDEAFMKAPDSSRRFDECRTTLRKAIALDPELLEAQLLLVESLVLGGEHDSAEAVREASEMRRRHPESAEAEALVVALQQRGSRPSPSAPAPALAPVPSPPSAPASESAVPPVSAVPVAPPALPDPAPGKRPELLLYYRALTCGVPTDAIPLLERAMAINPWFLDGELQLAVRHREAKQFEAMLADAELLTRAQPDLPLSWSLKGAALYRLRRFEDAVAAHGTALELDKSHWRSYYDRALALHSLRRTDEELADLALAEELSPGNPRIPALRGDALVRSDLALALENYDRAIALGDTSAWMRHSRADALRQLKRFDEAITELTTALDGATDPNMRARLLRTRGAARLSKGDTTEALADLRESVSLRPTARAWSVYGRTCLQEGRFDESIHGYDEALRLDPLADAEYERAVAQWFAGDADAAAPVLERWANMRYPWIYVWLWDLESSRGRRSAAAAALAAAGRARDPEDPALVAVVEVLSGNEPSSSLEWDTMDAPHRLYAGYALGAHAKLEGNPSDAETYWKRALDLGVDEFESDIVRHHLAQLNGSESSSR